MRILQIVSGKSVNGAVKHCLDLSLILAARGHEVHVACKKDAWIGDQLAGSGVAVIESDLKRFPLTELKRVAQYIADHEIDVVHTHMSSAHFFGVLLKWFAKVPCVASAHCRQFQLHWRFNDYVIAVSDATRKYHQSVNRVKQDRIGTIHNFVHLPELQDDESVAAKERDMLVNSLGIPADSKLITFVGGLEKRKGLAMLFESMPKVFDAHPDTRLLIIGDHVQKSRERKYVDAANARAAELGVTDRIHYLGFRENVTEILSHSDVFVLPSIEESFPLTILEAMSVGVPVVATDVGGVKECVMNGHNGFIVPSGDVAALGERLSEVLANPAAAKQMGRHGRSWVQEHYGIDGQLAKIEQVFEKVVTGGTAKKTRTSYHAA